MTMKPFAAIVIAAALTACGSSPPTHFYTLDPVPSTVAASSVAVTPVQVVVVHIPPTLDREQMVRENAPNRLDVSDQDRWAAPLGEMMQRILTRDLTQRLPKGAVILPQQPAPPDVRKIVVDVLQFERQASGAVKFDGSWSLLRAGVDTPVATRFVRLSENAGAGSAAQAQAMSRILGRIADQIAAEARRSD